MKVIKDFNTEIFKNNLVTIVTMTIIVLCLILIDVIPKITEKEIIGLEDETININKLVINEIMTSNKGAFADPEGNCYDWVELYNGTSKDIDLTGYMLSDEESGKTKWIFPATTIERDSYLIVYLSGTNNKGLYANFALDKTGNETLTLKKRNGKVVDTVKIEQIDKNNVMARNKDGRWFETTDITPGYSNNVNGRNDYLENIHGQSDPIIITEFLPSNKGNISFDGNFYSYIEIKNISSKEINLRNYSVSNDITKPFQYKLPDISLEGNESYLIYTSNENHDNHTNFVLNKKTGTVILAKGNKIIEQVDYQNLTNGFAYIKENNEFYEGTNISPGYDNSPSGVEEYANKELVNPKSLIINEVMTSNKEYLLHNGGEAYNWIELYNNSDKPFNLKNYYLTTDEENKTMFQLPNEVIRVGETKVIMASGDETLSTDRFTHTNFKLNGPDGLYIYDTNGELVDSMFVPNIPIDYSYGRNLKNGFYYFKTPTPNTPNKNDGNLEVSYTPRFKTTPGVYNDTEELAVNIDASGEIYYTLDGSVPNTKSYKYTEPIVINKTTVIRAIAKEDDKRVSNVLTGSFFLNENHTLPVVSVSLPPNDFVEVLNQRFEDTKYSASLAHVELYENNNSFSIDCGFKLFGSATRLLDKKSFSLKFSSKYGPSSLKYKVFDNREATSFNTLVLRSGSQDYVEAMMRDELATSILDKYSTIDVQAYKPVILYVNGEYYGLYYLREKIDEDFIAQHYNVSDKGTNIFQLINYVDVGNMDDYTKLIEFVENNDLTIEDNYNYVISKLDLENYIDYWVSEGFVHNTDLLNVRFFNNPAIENGKYKMIFYDIDYGFYNIYGDYYSFAVDWGNGEIKYNTLLKKLLQNPDFQNQFIKRVEWNMENVWTKEHLYEEYNHLVELIEPEMKRNQERWNLTYEDWQKSLKNIKSFIDNRENHYIENTLKFLDKQ